MKFSAMRFIISGTKLHYQTKVDQTLVSNPFKLRDHFRLQLRASVSIDPDLRRQRLVGVKWL